IDITNKSLLDLLEHNERLLNGKDDESIKMLIERGWPLDFDEFCGIIIIEAEEAGRPWCFCRIKGSAATSMIF
ncbi:MAG: hypothetical protein LUH17_00165, partial [Acidaminococcaceae bacterium]|nr:hypothetical protein [Acidaminococcaceae bacterium]